MASNISASSHTFRLDSASLSYFLIPATALCALAVVRFSQKGSSNHEYFPSPPSDPILGNLRIMPSDFPWLSFTEWGKKLGDIVYVTVIGRPIIIINTAEVALDLMDKRGANYSDRPTSVLHSKLLTWGNMLGFCRYGDQFRTQRRFVHQYLNSNASRSLLPIQEEQVRMLLGNLLICPNGFHKHLNRASSATIVKLTYGYDIVSDDDKYINLAVTAVSRVFSAGSPGLALVDIFPFLQYIPSWFPGAGFKREAKITRRIMTRMIDEPYEKVLEERAHGTAQPSILNSLLERYENSNVDKELELNMKLATGNMYIGGVETSEVVIMTFILMMVRNPEVMKRAQAEIDRAVGTEQLPTLEDRDNLPYIDCILKEVFRINPPFPLGVSRQSMEEDLYRGKTIPARSMIIQNIWQMMRDERYFPNPEDFIPERYLAKQKISGNNYMHALNSFNADDPSSLVFGFGRRICPGRFFADNFSWITIANILAVFDILPHIDPVTGKETIPAIEYTSGLTSKPKLFDCRITPRSAKHASLINQECV